MIRSIFQWAITGTVLCLCSAAEATDEAKPAARASSAGQSDEPKDAEKGNEEKPDSPALKALRELAGKCRFQRNTAITAEPVPASPVPGNPDVKSTPAALTFTARQISRQFSASDGTELRLMPRPLMEFKSEKQQIPYGAVFAYATGTNPSMLLILQVEETAAGKRWMYRPVHMTAVELTLNHDGKPIWKGVGQSPSEVSTWGYFFTYRNSAIK